MGTENFEEAAYYELEQKAWDATYMFVYGEVCTLTLGGIELMSDLLDEMDEMTLEEYAYEVGARP